MSFTKEELQSFNAVLEQRFQAHREEVEQAFDQRITPFRRYIEQRMYAMEQEILRVMSFQLSEVQVHIETFLNEKVNAWQQALAIREATNDAELLNGHQELEAIEVQTELPWEDLANLIGQTLDERLASFKEESPVLKGLLQGIEHIERVVESMQVVMTANHALLSDRLYSHQQQPVERAHPTANLPASTPVEL